MIRLAGQFIQYQHLDDQPTLERQPHQRAPGDRDNRLWVGTLSGLDHFESETGTSIIIHTHPPGNLWKATVPSTRSISDVDSPSTTRYFKRVR
jgi:ligand-binding sensor domain-containing protein